MTEWIAIAIAIVGPAIGIFAAYRATDAVTKRRWVEMEGVINNFRNDHVQHFEDSKKSHSDVARVEQRLSDHEKYCEEIRREIKEMFKEIREALRERSS